MKTLFALIFLLAFAGSAMAQGYMSCGLPPFPPLGCSGPPECVCSGNVCQWQFTNCE